MVKALNTKFPLIAVLLFVLMAPASFSQDIVSAEKVFDIVSTEYGKVADYTASVIFTQGKNQSRGRLSYKSPLFLRVDFDDPKDQVLIIDGEKLTIYVPQYHVVLIQRYKKKLPADLTALANKQGLTMMKSNYGIAFDATPDYGPLDDGSKEQVIKLRLNSKSSGAPFSQIILAVGKDNLIRRLTGFLGGGDTFVMDLTNVKTNQNIPNTRFQYETPADASIQDDFLFDSGG
jgi:outer membrane lipoprotein-sorting protein